MTRERPRRPRWSVVLALIAAGLLAARGILELREGSGWQLLLIAAAVLFAGWLRHVVYRD